MEEPGTRIALDELAARALGEWLASAPVGAALPHDPYPAFFVSAELLIPTVLARAYEVWRWESLDGIFAVRAVRSGERSVELLGTAILMGDQSVTPLALSAALDDSGTAFTEFRVRLGEQGGGTLGISGPLATSPAASTLRLQLAGREHEIEWVFEAELWDEPAQP